jgi:hypothetical protein
MPLIEDDVNKEATETRVTSGTRRVNLVTNVIISREYGKNQKVLPTNGTYRWSL